MVTFENEALRKLSSPDHLELLNAIDRLRLQGISNYVSLPQIIVCGDQSSGKSSVLEALAGVPFPVKSNLCTRFPTELVLRRSTSISANVSIKPDESRNETEQAALSRFIENLDGFDALASVIDSAKLAMGISMHGKAFSKDLLRVEISGPNYPHLTIVDLPGLIHSETKNQTSADVELVQKVVQSYMEEPRSIILAVVSAKNDFANQVVLKLARKADPTGQRTLGVITKPDTLTPGSASESSFISLAKNHEFPFRLGWHVLKNLDSEKDAGDLVIRDASETEFLSTDPWSTLPLFSKGIDQLRSRLSKVLLKQISSELPGLIDEIQEKHKACHVRLEKLGFPRSTEPERRRYLVEVSQALQSLVKSALDGTYENPFFGDSKTDEGYTRRMRAVIQNLNIDFADQLRVKGHFREVVSGVFSVTDDSNEITEMDFLDHIEEVMRRTRGRELPGTVNPLIVMELFREQCGPWESLLHGHVQEVWDAATSFLDLAIAHVADESTFTSLKRDIFDPVMDTILAGLHEKATRLLRPYREGHPITYNHYFTETLQAVRHKRMNPIDPRSVVSKFFATEPTTSNALSSKHWDLKDLIARLTPPTEPDMNRYAAREAMDCLNAYYKVALKNFVDGVCIQVVEEGLIAEIGGIFSPISVYSLDSTQVKRIAGESEDTRALREELNKQMEVFAKGLETCKKFVGLRISGASILRTSRTAVGLGSSVHHTGSVTSRSGASRTRVGVPISYPSETSTELIDTPSSREHSDHQPKTPIVTIQIQPRNKSQTFMWGSFAPELAPEPEPEPEPAPEPEPPLVEEVKAMWGLGVGGKRRKKGKGARYEAVLDPKPVESDMPLSEEPEAPAAPNDEIFWGFPARKEDEI